MEKIREGDDVVVVAGRDKGKRGVVLARLDKDLVLVEGVGLVKRHVRPNPTKGEQGGIVKKEKPVHLSNIALFNPNKQGGDRVGIRVLEDGRKVRFFKSNGELVEA